MQTGIFRLFLPAALTAVVSYGHQQPTTLVQLEMGTESVTMDLHVPLNELELAFGHQVTERPEEGITNWGPSFKAYLTRHIRPVTGGGQPWVVSVQDMKIGNAEQAQSGRFQEALVRLLLIPPSGASPREFVLGYDVIMHQVVTHRALVSIHNDWASGRLEPAQAGVIAVDTGTGRIEPLAIHLGEGSWWMGFKGMIGLGMEHIRAGTDHLLFLLVLLLPVTLSWRGGSAGGVAQDNLAQLVKIVTAFTMGHSLTLLAGALQWLALPQRPVEVLIACSILVTAIHAIRPIFPGREAHVAAGFGLVHGLAFASVLTDLKLEPGPMALSILGFNLGIEAMQLFVMALILPWLILISATAARTWVRNGGAAMAAMAALGWIANRVSGESNGIERLMTEATDYAPVGILLLALAAMLAQLHAAMTRPVNRLVEEEGVNQ